MADNMFGGLGGLGDIIGGFAKNVVPKDSAEGKLLNAQSDLSDLKKQEADLLQEIGRQAYEQNPSAWPQDAKLQLIRQNLQAAESSLKEAEQAQVAADAAKAAEDAVGRCPSCGFKNPDGVKFCQECGASLAAAAPRNCTACGAVIQPGIQFCGECGARAE